MSARLLSVAVLLAAGVARADLFSPGDLARQHQNLEGLSNCTECHPAGKQLAPEPCLDCHTELKGRWEKGQGFHGRMPAEKKQACEGCHHEHQGRDFALVSWGAGGKKAFDHKLSGYPLDGAHLKTDCDACHGPRRIKDPAVRKLLEKQPRRVTYLGTGTTCVACHFDEHRGQVGTECESCHDTRDWKPAPEFDHDDTDYALKGKHKKVECKGCHPTVKDPEGKGTFPAAKFADYMKYAPLEFRACTDCHKDPHEGKFGQRCQSCHVVEGWSIVREGRKDRAFHEKTKYPLKGEHEDVECRACHGPWPGKKAKFKGMDYDDCADCHPDGHVGQLTSVKGKDADCAACHTVDGFRPGKYDLEAHAKTRYPLEGAHRVVGCRVCHPPSSATLERVPAATRNLLKNQRRPLLVSLVQFQLKAKTDKCDSCHKDVHGGQFEAGCKSCHGPDTFRLPKFDHADTRYPLEGAHAKVECGKCHGAEPNGVVRYAPLPLTCEGCHDDVHLGQFARAGQRADCQACHAVKDWKELRFKHAPPFTESLLDGKHARAKCAACHPTVEVGRSQKAVRYRPLPKDCEGCHRDFHQGAFQGFVP